MAATKKPTPRTSMIVSAIKGLLRQQAPRRALARAGKRLGLQKGFTAGSSRWVRARRADERGNRAWRIEAVVSASARPWFLSPAKCRSARKGTRRIGAPPHKSRINILPSNGTMARLPLHHRAHRTRVTRALP
jgi:hypothetical protein